MKIKNLNISLAVKEESGQKPAISGQVVKKEVSFAALQEKVAEIQTSLADMGEEEDDEVTKEDLENLARSLYSSLDYYYRYIENVYSKIYSVENNMWQALSDHMIGHIPKIKSTEQMTKVLEVIGLDKEYEIVKQKIYASDGTVSKTLMELVKKDRE